MGVRSKKPFTEKQTSRDLASLERWTASVHPVEGSSRMNSAGSAVGYLARRRSPLGGADLTAKAKRIVNLSVGAVAGSLLWLSALLLPGRTLPWRANFLGLGLLCFVAGVLNEWFESRMNQRRRLLTGLSLLIDLDAAFRLSAVHRDVYMLVALLVIFAVIVWPTGHHASMTQPYG